MTVCPSKQQLDRLLREELSDPELSELLTHVEDCSACQETLHHMALSAPGPTEPNLRSTLSEPDHSGPAAEAAAFFDRLTNRARSETTPKPEIEGYELLEEIGRGATGVVYRARHRELDRLVALKLILAGPYLSTEGRLRFRREAQAVARLQHPNIVQIYDVGEHAGFPYLALELVEGASLGDWLGGLPRLARDAAQITTILAKAVDHAHGQGVLHRDLKPANILLRQERASAAPADKAVDARMELESLKITDFGLAKFLSTTDVAEQTMTQSGAIMGTPAYVAPEQARGEVAEVGPTADVYSLGVILYELLTGRPPFQGTTPMETLLQAAHQEPVPPGQLAPKTPRDLQTICLKCLEKNPAKRYPSAAELVADLERFSNHEPIKARPVGSIERLLRWMHRHSGFSAALAIVTLLLVLLVVGSLLTAAHFRDLERVQSALASEKGKLADENGRLVVAKESERKKAVEAESREAGLRTQAEKQSEEFRQSLYFARMNLIGQAVLSPSGGGRIREFLTPWEPKPGERTRPDLRQWEWYYLNGLCFRERSSLPSHSAAVLDVAWRPDGRRLISASADGALRMWDIDEEREMGVKQGHSGAIRSVAWSRDGRRLASAGSDGTIKIWNAENGEVTLTYRGHTGEVFSVAWSPDDSTLASGGMDRTIQVWNPTTGERSREFRGHKAPVCCVAWNPHGHRLASAGVDTTIRLWDTKRAEETHKLIGHLNCVNSIAWNADGSRLASASNDCSVKIWDPVEAKEIRTLRGHTESVLAVVWSPDSSSLATTSDDQTIKVWAAGGGATSTLRGRTGISASIDWSPDGKQLASANLDGTIKLWDATAPPETLALHSLAGDVDCVAWRGDGQLLASGSSGGPVQVWDMSLNKQRGMLHQHKDWVHSVSWEPHGERLVSAGSDGVIRVWNTHDGQLVNSLSGHAGEVFSVAWSPDARWLASAGEDHTVRVWDAMTGKQTQCYRGHDQLVRSVAWSPESTRLASGSWDKTVKVWDVVNGRANLSLLGHTDSIPSVTWNPDGQRLASASSDGTIRTWDAVTGKPIHILRGHTAPVTSVAWSPDGKRLVSASLDQTLKVWDPDTGMEALTLAGQEGDAIAVAWSSDGLALASAWSGQTILIHDAAPGYEAERAPRCLSALDRRPPADPKNGSQWRLRAEIHARQKDWAAAAADVREYLKLNPDKRWLAVGSWVAGPYSDDPNAGYPPEGDAAFAQTADANGGSLKSDDVRWQSVPSNANGFINFSSLYNHAEHMSAYALMRIYAPEKCPVAILLGSDDQVRLWLNGKLIHENLQFRRAAPDADATSTILAAGWNSLLARVINATGEHALYLRLSDPPADLLRAQNEAKH